MTVDSPEDLYGLPLDRFISERAALVKTLRGEKRRAEASEVGARRKPSVAAWAVNQLIRTQAKEVQVLFEAGDDLAEAQARAGSGEAGAADAMRDATRRQRDAMRELIRAAEGLLNSDGQALTQATIERVAETLRAAAVDPGARDQVQGGCLTQELRFAGLGLGGAGPSSPDPEKPAGRRADAARDQRADREAKRARAAARETAGQTEAEARRAAACADDELAAAQARREAAAASLAEAETRLRAAARRAEETAAKLQTAERALRDLD